MPTLTSTKTAIPLFRSPALPAWQGLSPYGLDRTLEDLARNSERAAIGKFMGHSSGTVMPVPVTEVFQDRVAPEVHTAGRSGAQVSNTDPSYGVEAVPWNGRVQTLFTPIAPGKVLKRNPLRAQDELEYRLYKVFRAQGLPVPNVERTEEGLVMDYLGQATMDQVVFKGMKFNPQLVKDMLYRMARMISEFDACAQTALDQEDLTRAERIKVDALAERLGVDPDRVQERYSLFRILRTIPYADRGLVDALEPVEDQLNRNREQYGCTSVGIFPRNLFPIQNNESLAQLVAIDFNLPDPLKSLPEADALAFDAYLPVQGWGSALPIQLDGKYVTTPLDEEARAELVKHRLEKWEALTRQRIDREEYAAATPAARFVVNLGEAYYMLGEAARALTFPGIVMTGEGVRHHLQLALDNLSAAGRQVGIDYMNLAQDIWGRFAEAHKAMIPGEVVQATRDWAEQDALEAQLFAPAQVG